MKIAAGSKLVMIGDLVTDCERARPIGEGLFGALGKGYVSYIDALIGAVCPEDGIRIVNMGIGGNTVRDLKNRWESDVMALEPDWVSIMIGINDVWRQFDLPRQTEIHVLLDEYERDLEDLLVRTEVVTKGVVLMTPFYIEPNVNDPMRARMDEYGAIARRLAEQYDAILVDTQAAFNQALQTYYPATLAWDRVHPNATGHMILAKAFLDAVEFRWE